MTFNLHLLIKFWARKDPELISREIGNTRLVADPFCGSGSSGFSAILNNASAILSDINPVSVFISYNILNSYELDINIVKAIEGVCNEIEEEVYTLSNSKKVSFAVWRTSYRCPYCGQDIDSLRGSMIKCRKCSRAFSIRDAVPSENVVLLKFVTGEVTNDEKLIKEYLDIEKSIEVGWYPEGRFVYPGTEIEFKDGPHRSIEIKDLFTKRNLYVVSKLYSYIEEIWRRDQVQGDLLKLAFIASLASATKMIPHAGSSGPSWKIPRYWIPSLGEERNFCRAFLGRLSLLHSFKKMWSVIASKYQITASFTREIIISNEKKFVHICLADALELCPELPKSDLIILDPPHYDEINYFELTYLWQKWLEGRYMDPRFRDYGYWRKEISINRKVGKDLQWYINKLREVIICYTSRLHKGGKIVLILHNRDRNVLEATIREIRESLENNFTFETSYETPKVPSSTQGLHKHKKYLYIVRIKRAS